MRTFAALSAATLTLGVLGATTASGSTAIPLSGDQEAAAADPDGHGFFTYDLDGTTFCWTLEWQGIDTASAAHVHKAPRHVAGPIVIPLSVGDGSGALVSGCTEIDSALAADLSAHPKAYYVNVHNAAFQAGAIRGQLK
jgi:hypothetical protein